MSGCPRQGACANALVASCAPHPVYHRLFHHSYFEDSENHVIANHSQPCSPHTVRLVSQFYAADALCKLLDS
jgi:hypothetical protein